MKPNNCGSRMSLSELKVKLHVCTEQNSSTASDQSILNFILFYYVASL